MDRDEALRLLRGGPEGIAEWNRRQDAGEEIPDLGGVNLFNADSHGRKPPHISQAIASTFSQNLKISGGPV
jgi:hypothetical protein